MKYYAVNGLVLLLTGLMMVNTLAFRESRFVPAASVVAAEPVSHAIFDQLTKNHVDSKGLVNYKGFRSDAKELKKYLDLLAKNPPADTWSKDEQIAYWINAYNANTIQLILNHYPVKSIKDIGSKVKIPFVNTPWDIKFIKVGGETYDLNRIEHGTLRKRFDDQRIHFALVCAARSCPKLRNEAYTAAKLNAQLESQGSDFLNDPAKNAVTVQKASLSKYFDWYKGDWKENAKSVEYWVNKYAKTKINKDTQISFLEYNWSLNEQ